MNKKTLMKKLSSLLIILAILIQMFPIATYAQETRHAQLGLDMSEHLEQGLQKPM